jgi:hypothetical protein
VAPRGKCGSWAGCLLEPVRRLPPASPGCAGRLHGRMAASQQSANH